MLTIHKWVVHKQTFEKNALHYLTLCILVDFPETWAGVDDPVAEAARGGDGGGASVIVCQTLGPNSMAS